MKHTVGIDLGGTNTKLGLVDQNLNVVAEHVIPTESKSGVRASVTRWVGLIRDWQRKHELDYIGIGSPGPLDCARGMILTTPNLVGWENFPITETLKKETGLPTYIENDANCAAVGEHGKNKISDFVLLTLGTGVGSGVVSGGHLVRGINGLGVEAGHMVIDRGGPICGCGRRGCLEAFVGGRLFVERYNEKSKDKIRDLDARSVFVRAKKNDQIAQELVEDWVEGLAVGIGNLINIFNPTQVILSGGLSAAYQEIKPVFLEILLREAFEPSLKYCEVVVSQLQERAALLGAALWARQQNHHKNERNKKMS